MSRTKGPALPRVYKRTNGTWVATVPLADGQRKFIYGHTKAEVLAHQKALVLAQSLLPRVEPQLAAATYQTVGEYLTDWLRDIAKPGVRPRVHLGYQSLIRNHVLPNFGSWPLTSLRPPDLQSLYGKKLEAGLSPGTVTNLHRCLRRAFSHAVRWNLLVKNPADLVDPPKVRRHEIQPLSENQVKAFFHEVSGDRFEALYLLATTSGMRLSELIGLKWVDIDLDLGILQVRRNIQRVAKLGFVEDEPKSRTSSRMIHLMPNVVAALRAHKLRQITESTTAGPRYQDRGLVFANKYGKPMEAGNLERRSYWPILERAGLPKDTRFHDLRHTTASLLLQRGVHPKVVQELLGHASMATTTDIYSHVAPAMHREAIMSLQGLFSDPD